MADYFSGIVDFVGAHPNYAFVAVLLLALSEAIPVVGTVVPGSTLILAISALATGAAVSSWLLLLAAVVGAVAGDGLSFWLRRDSIGLATQSVSAADWSQRSVHQQIWCRERVSGPLHGGRARICPFARWHSKHVAAQLLCGQHSVGACLGAGSRVSWRAAGSGDEIGRRQRGSPWRGGDSRTDFSMGGLGLTTVAARSIRRALGGWPSRR